MKQEFSFLQKEYFEKIIPFIKNKYQIENIHLVPKIEKIVLGMRLGKESNDKKAIESAMEELMLISGQKPNYSKAKKSISGFKLREGQVIGVYVTLRKRKMYEFLERLIYISLPRVRDFKGYKSTSFDTKFNLSIGIKEHLVFRELSYDKIKTRGLDISFSLKNLTSSEMAVDFLKLFNFPIK